MAPPPAVAEPPLQPNAAAEAAAGGGAWSMLCGHVLDSRGHHACICEVGGGVLLCHDHVRDWLAGWVAERSGQVVNTEQFVPRWDRVAKDGTVERARLDVVFSDT